MKTIRETSKKTMVLLMVCAMIMGLFSTGVFAESTISVTNSTEFIDAINNAPSDGSQTYIKLDADINIAPETGTELITDKNITLDLNGKKLISNTRLNLLVLRGNTTLEIIDTSEQANGEVIVLQAGYSVISSGGSSVVTISGGSLTSNGSTIEKIGSGNLYVTGGSLSSTALSGGAVIFNNSNSTGNMIISGGTLSSENTPLIWSVVTTTTISGGTFNGVVYTPVLNLSGNPSLTIALNNLTNKKFSITGPLTGEQGSIILDGTNLSTVTSNTVVASALDKDFIDASKFNLIHVTGKTLTESVSGFDIVMVDIPSQPTIGSIETPPAFLTGTDLNEELTAPLVKDNGYHIVTSGWVSSSSSTGPWQLIPVGSVVQGSADGHFLRYFVTYSESSVNKTIYSNMVVLTINRYMPTLVLSVTPSSPQNFGTKITLTATLAQDNPSVSVQGYFNTVPITFKSGSTYLGTAIIDENTKKAVFEFSPSIGNHSLTAEFPGETDYNTSTTSNELTYSITYESDSDKLYLAKTSIESSLVNLAVSNLTTANDILEAATNAALHHVEVAWYNTNGFNKVNATVSSAGQITGTLELTLNSEVMYVNVDKTILQLNQAIVTNDSEFSTALSTPSLDGSYTVVKLANDIVLNISKMSITKNIIIDLNGYKLSKTMNGIEVTNNSNLEITDTSVDANGILDINISVGFETIAILGSGSVTVSAGTVKSNRTVYNKGTGSITITGGKVTSESIVIRNESTGTINVTEGLVSTSSAAPAIFNVSTGVINVSGGTVFTPKTYGNTASIRSTNSGPLNISGGNIGLIEAVILSVSGNPTLEVYLQVLTSKKVLITGPLTGEEGNIILNGSSLAVATEGTVVAFATSEEYVDTSKFLLTNLLGKTLVKSDSDLVLMDSGDAEKIVEAKISIQSALANLAVSNATTANDILSAANNATLHHVVVTWDSIDGFDKTNATRYGTGLISGSLVLTLNSEVNSMTVNKTIAQFTEVVVSNETQFSTAIYSTSFVGSYTVIKLDSNINVTATSLVIIKNIIIDLNGYEINFTSSSGMIRVDGSNNLEITDTSVNANGVLRINTSDTYAIFNLGSGTITVSKGSVTSNSFTIYNNSAGSINVTGGVVATTSPIFLGYAAIQNNGSGSVNISGGTVSSISQFSIFISNEAGPINVSGGILGVVRTRVINISGDPSLRLALGSAINITGEITGADGNIILDGLHYKVVDGVVVATAGNALHAVASKFTLVNVVGKTLVKSGSNLILVDSTTQHTDVEKVAEAKSAIETAVANLAVNNTTTGNDILNVATNASLHHVVVEWDSANGFNKVIATSSATGSITGTLKLTLNSVSGSVIVNKTITKLQSDPINPITDATNVSEAKAAIEAALASLAVNNTTTSNDILNAATNATLHHVVVEWDSANGFNKVIATSSATGSITGTLKLTLNSVSDSVIVNKTITKLQSDPINPITDATNVSEAKAAIEAAFVNLVVSNTTTVSELLKAAQDAINNNASVAWDSIKGFVKVDATTLADGSIIGTLIISLNDASEKVVVNMVIKQLSSETPQIKEVLINASTGVKIEGVNGTVFDLQTELVVTPVMDTLDSSIIERFGLGVSSVNASLQLVQLYDIKLMLNGLAIQPDGMIKVTLPLTADQLSYTNLQVVFIADDGTVTVIDSTLSGNQISFITDHFSYYGVVGTPISTLMPDTSNSNSSFVWWMMLLGSMLVILTGKKREEA